jgi:hypothetical protein
MAAPTALLDLRNAPKFGAHELYTGPDTPQDGPALTALVNKTLDDVLSWPTPIDAARLRTRLEKLIEDVDDFATEDRDEDLSVRHQGLASSRVYRGDRPLPQGG